jgi:peptide chain release factor 1
MNSQLQENLRNQLKEVEKKLKETEAMKADPDMEEVADEELKKLEEEKKALEKSLAQARGEFDNGDGEGEIEGETDKRAALIEIRGAAGGEEAKIWANDLLRMYTRFANSLDFKVSELDDLVIKVSGAPLLFPKDAEEKRNNRHSGPDPESRSEQILNQVQDDGRRVQDDVKPDHNGNAKLGLSQTRLGPYGIFKYEAGVHRVQRVPVTESQGRIHTSTATVAVLPEVSEAEVKIDPSDIVFEPYRAASGHGGQNVNKVATAVRITHKPTGLVVESRRERKQEQNRKIAMDMLLAKLWEMEEEKRESEEQGLRQEAVGRGMRSEKIRTYNFPQNRVTDHRVKKSWHNLEATLDGELGKVVKALLKSEIAF